MYKDIVFLIQVVLLNKVWGIKAEVWDQAAVVCCALALPTMLDRCLADLFCIPALEPPCYGSTCHIPTAVTVVDTPLLPPLPPFFISLYITRSLQHYLPFSLAVAAFDLGLVVTPTDISFISFSKNIIKAESETKVMRGWGKTSLDLTEYHGQNLKTYSFQLFLPTMLNIKLENQQ